jgi:hypothetical protein
MSSTHCTKELAKGLNLFSCKPIFCTVYVIVSLPNEVDKHYLRYKTKLRQIVKKWNLYMRHVSRLNSVATFIPDLFLIRAAPWNRLTGFFGFLLAVYKIVKHREKNKDDCVQPLPSPVSKLFSFSVLLCLAGQAYWWGGGGGGEPGPL